MMLLSFDIEEFDVLCEHGVDSSFEEGMRAPIEGTNRILDILRANNVCVTFFCTGNFAELAPEVMGRTKNEGHEAARHGIDHWQPKPEDVFRSKEIIERITGVKAAGYHQSCMSPVPDEDIEKAGYLYNSFLNPAFIPGRYMYLTTLRTWFIQGKITQIPASVSPHLRAPLFWLSMHNFPEWFYLRLVWQVSCHNGYFAAYLHLWEFYDLKPHPESKMPFIVKNHSGHELEQQLDRLIKAMKVDKQGFITYVDSINRQKR